jgi:chromosome segregation ATPase
VARLAEEARRNGDEAKEYKALSQRLEAEKTALAKQMANRKKEGEMLASKAEEILSTVDDQENVIAKSKETVAALREENKKLRETLATQKVVLEAEKGELQKKLRAHNAEKCEQDKKDLMAQVEALRDSTARQIDPNGMGDASKVTNLTQADLITIALVCYNDIVDVCYGLVLSISY